MKPSLVVASWTAAASAASTNRFDLVCKGTEQKRTGIPASAWTERFRIDLISPMPRHPGRSGR